MAIFVAFAWMIEAAEYLGLIEIEAQDPQSRAYRLAHQGLGIMKTELAGFPLEVLGEHRVRKGMPDTTSVVIESTGGMVNRRREGALEPIIDLGPGGGISFQVYGAGVELKIHARIEDDGAYDVNLILPPPVANPYPSPHRRRLRLAPPPSEAPPSDAAPPSQV